MGKGEVADLRISDLEKMTGVGRSAIHYYLRKGLLSPPRRSGQTMAYYDSGHVQDLKAIRRWRREGFPLGMIERKLGEARRKRGEKGGEREPARMDRRQQILDAAVEVFARKGFHKARISDITGAAGVGYSTFYLYFPNKLDLLAQGVDEILQAMFADVIEEIKHEANPLKRLRKRAEVAVVAHPEFIDILSVLRGTTEDEPRLDAKRRELYDYIAEHVSRDLGKAVRMGLIPPLDVETTAFMLVVGVLESAALLSRKDQAYDANRLLDCFQHILLPHGSP
ncbi:MAG: TetR family transcriptional regulator [Actinobacteria bacterium]|jgi:AcrR family transcriptional regulator|nr:MAG: TetR family transcriptional regulator [Actinomycetota bacterium]